MELDQDSPNAQIATEAARVRVALGRSIPLIQLLDFLLQSSLAGRVPKEIEIAHQVFGKSTAFDMMQDASVRVYIHRLRRKIDEFYAGATGPCLIIPKGEYRLAIDLRAAGADDMPQEAEAPQIDGPRRRLASRTFWLAGAILIAVNVAIWLLVIQFRPVDPNHQLAETPFWKQLAEGGRPIFLVTGDYYIFGDAPTGGQVTRLVRDFSINSQEDLDHYLVDHPDERPRFTDVDLHYLPASTARALADLLPIVNTTAKLPVRPWVLTVSEITPDTLKGVNILYVGLLSGLAILHDPLFEVAGISVGANYDELIDRASGKRYTSDWSNVTGRRTQHRDYAYLASFPGASGNRVLVVSGTRDAGVKQAAEIAKDKKQLDQIAQRVGDHASFEALYEVRTLGNVNLGSTLVLARPLNINPSRTLPQDNAMNRAGVANDG